MLRPVWPAREEAAARVGRRWKIKMFSAADKIRRGAQGVNDVAMSIALPKEHPPKRIPTFPQLERTSVLTLERNETVAVGGGVATSSRAAITRMPAHPLWFDTFLTSTTYMYTTAVFSNSCSDVSFAAMTDPAPLATYQGRLWALCPADSVATGSVLEMRLVNAATVNVTIEYTDGAEVRSLHVVGLTTTLAILTLPAGVWFRVANVDATAAVANRISFRLLAAASDYYLVPRTTLPLELVNSRTPYADTRCSACAALFTNVTKTVNREGTVLAARMNASRLGFGKGPWNFLQSDLSSVHPAERYFGPLEKGLYTFTAPTAEAEVFTECYAEVDTLVTFPDILAGVTRFTGLSTIADMSFFNSIVFTDEDVATTTNLAVTNSVHLEFRTTSSLFTTGYSAIPLEAYHAAQLALCSTGYFFENPIHWAALGALLLRGLRAAVPVVAPYIVEKIVGHKAPVAPKSTPKSRPQPTKPKAKKARKARRTRSGKVVVRR